MPRRAGRPGAFGEVLSGVAAHPPAAGAAGAVPGTAAVAVGAPAPHDPRAGPRRREARRRVGLALADLEGLQRDLLEGRTDRARLARIVALAAAVPAGEDVPLVQLADEIALRARIELARAEVAEARLAAAGAFTRG